MFLLLLYALVPSSTTHTHTHTHEYIYIYIYIMKTLEVEYILKIPRVFYE